MSFVCEICNKSFVHKAHLKRHLLNHGGEKSHVCEVCNKSFFRKENLKKHSLIHSGERSHVCHVCNRTFSWKQTLKEHLLVHTGESPYVCNVCNRSFSQRGHLKNHALIHIGEKPHICNICNKAFTERGTMRRHMLTHSGEKSHVCVICDKSFSRKDFLRRHSLLHSGRTPEKKVKKVEFSIVHDDRSNLCSFCKKAFIENVCSKLQFSGPKQKSPYACESCLENFVEIDDTKRKSKAKSGVSCGTSNAVEADESVYGNCDPENLEVEDDTIYIIKEEHDIKCESSDYLNANEKINEKIPLDYKEPECVLKEERSLDSEAMSYGIKKENINIYKTDDDIEETYNVVSEEGASKVVQKTSDVDKATDKNDVRQKYQFNKDKSDVEFNIMFVNVKEEPIVEYEENLN